MTTSSEVPMALGPGMRWPSGEYVELAVLNVDEAYLCKLFDRPLLEGNETGLGLWRAIGAQLKSGAVIELISYEHDRSAGFTLRVDARQDLLRVLQEAIKSLGLDDKAVIWKSPLIA